MKWEEFIEIIKMKLEEKIYEEETVKLHHVQKNNGVFLCGICILKKGGKITPTIYLEEYYENFKRGMSLEAIVESIIDKYRNLQNMDEMDLDFFTDFEQVRKRIVFRLVNLERNRERLKEMPYMEYLDFAVVFYCHVSIQEECHGAIPIYKKHMQMWKVDKNELWRLAMKNTQKLYPCELISMKEMIADMMGGFENKEWNAEELNAEPVPMYVLTNAYKLNGAAVILYRNVLKNFAKACKGDFYLLPSSIHEVILIPAMEGNSMEYFTDMVREVNETQVDEEELLSDHAYFYSKEQGQLMLSPMK